MPYVAFFLKNEKATFYFKITLFDFIPSLNVPDLTYANGKYQNKIYAALNFIINWSFQILLGVVFQSPAVPPHLTHPNLFPTLL